MKLCSSKRKSGGTLGTATPQFSWPGEGGTGAIIARLGREREGKREDARTRLRRE